MHKVYLLAQIFPLILNVFIWYEQCHEHYHSLQTCGIKPIIMFHMRILFLCVTGRSYQNMNKESSTSTFTEKCYQPKLIILETESSNQLYTDSCNKR